MNGWITCKQYAFTVHCGRGHKKCDLRRCLIVTVQSVHLVCLSEATETNVGFTTKSIMSGHCHNQTYGHLPSCKVSPFSGQYKIILKAVIFFYGQKVKKSRLNCGKIAKFALNSRFEQWHIIKAFRVEKEQHSFTS